MTANYEYKVGGSISDNSPSYVVRQADSDLYHGLKAGEFCYIFNSRQMGKTSLIVRTIKKLQAEGFACTSLDISARGNIKLEQWYAGIAYKLVNNFNVGNPSEFLLSWWRERDDISPVQRLEELIETVLLASIQSNIVICIDEIDSILSLDFSKDDFFALIRSCYEKRNLNSEYQRLTFALVGVATPGDLIADKRRTPFNIGRAIQLDGFKESEIEPLAKGFEGKVRNPLALMREVLAWTGGQPFLTQKVCRLLGDGGIVEEVVRSQIIENWESHDEPEHLKTIRDRLLLGEQVAGRFLGWYQQILLSGDIAADDSTEQMRFRLTGLVVKQQDRLKVYNKIYESVFNLNWVEKELDKLRPYSENFNVWLDSNHDDESRLLRGQALQDALIWAEGKSLSNEDSRYLAASHDLEKKELEAALMVKEEEGRILALANETLSQAQQKSQRQMRFGSAFLAVSIVGAIIASVLAGNAQKGRENALKATRLEQAGVNLLRQPYRGTESESLLQAIRPARELKNLTKDKQSLADYPAYSPVFSLQKILSIIGERNHQLICQGKYDAPVFSPDGRILAYGLKDGGIQLKDVTTCKEISTLNTDKNRVMSIAFSPDGKTLATVQVSGDFNWSNSTHDRKTLASADIGASIKLWNLATGKEIYTLTGHKNTIISIAFSSDSKTLASADIDASIKLWNLAIGKEIYTLTGEKNWFNGVIFGSDDKTLITIASDLVPTTSIINLWDVVKRKKISTITTSHFAGLSPDGKTLASVVNISNPIGDPNGIELWNLRTGKKLYTMNGNQQFGIISVAFSPDGKILATGASKGTIVLWNIASGQEITTLTVDEYTTHTNKDEVIELVFSPDSKTLVSVSPDKTIKWSLDLDNLLALGCNHLKDDLAADGKLRKELCPG